MSRRFGERAAATVASIVTALVVTAGCSQPPGDRVLPGIDVVAEASASPDARKAPVVATGSSTPQSSSAGDGPTSSAGSTSTPLPSGSGAPMPVAGAPLPAPVVGAPGAPAASTHTPRVVTPSQGIGDDNAPAVTGPVAGAPPTGSRGSSAPGTPTSRTPSTTSPGSPVAAPVPMVEPTVVSPERTLPVEERVEQVFAISEPDTLAAAAGALWVKRDDGVLDRIDPTTDQVVASIATETAGMTPCAGLGGLGDVLWVCAGGGSVARIDPATNTQVALLDVGKHLDQGRIPIAFGSAWVLTQDGSRLVGISSETNAVTTSVDLPTSCTNVDTSEAAVWAVCPTEGLVLRIDPTTGVVTTTVGGLPGARNISVSTHVWVGYDAGTARIDRSTSEVTGAVSVGPDGSTGSLHATGDQVFIRTEDTFLQVLDATTLDLLEVVASDTGSGSTLLAYGSLWATSPEDGALYRLEPVG